MKKHRIERNLLFPSREFRDRVRSAASDRGFRSEQAFILTLWSTYKLPSQIHCCSTF